MSLPETRTLWEEGREPGREMASLGVALALTAAAVDLVLTGGVGVLFDLAFIALCGGLALAVRLPDSFTVGVLPPLLMLSTFLLLAMSRAEAIADSHDGLFQAVVSGLGQHSIALGTGYAVALAVLALRQRVARLRDEEPEPDLTRTGPGPRLHA